MVKIYAKVINEEKNPGTELFEKINKLVQLETVDKVEIDFSTISTIPSIYFSNSVGKLVEKYGLDFIKEKIIISNYNNQMAGAINLAINLAIEKEKIINICLFQPTGMTLVQKLLNNVIIQKKFYKKNLMKILQKKDWKKTVLKCLLLMILMQCYIEMEKMF